MYHFFKDELKQEKNKLISSLPSPLMQKIIESAQSVSDKGTVTADNMLQHIDHTQIEIVEGGVNIYDLIIREIKKARKQILIQTFVWMPDIQAVKDIKKALCELKQDIDVFLLVDQLDFIARTFFLGELPPQRPKHDPASLGLDGLPNNIRLHIGTYVHNFQAANHSKTILVDEAVIVTGANFQSENYGTNAFHDAAMFIPKGAADSVFHDFQTMWNLRTNKADEDCFPAHPPTNRDALNTNCPVLYVTNTIRLWPAILPLYQAALSPDPLNNTYLTIINHAEHIIRIAVPNINSLEVMQSLAHFINHRKGRVELLLSQNFNDFREMMYGGTNQSAIEHLSSMIEEHFKDNLQIRWFHQETGDKNNPINNQMHMKFMAVDESIVIYGSANLDYISLHNCHEGNFVFDNREFTKRATDTLFAPLFKQGIPAQVTRNVSCLLM